MSPGNELRSGERCGARPLLATLVAAASLALSLGCGRQPQMMADQPQYDPLEPSAFFKDGQSARPRVPGTVSRLPIVEENFSTTGKINGAFLDGYPFAVTSEVMARGQERFNIYCSMCHGRTGRGDGMVVRRGYRHPPSLHTADLRGQKSGFLFDVVTNGYGSMPAYGSMVPVSDRWAIIAYVRALQLSENATMNDVPPSERAQVEIGGGVKAE